VAAGVVAKTLDQADAVGAGLQTVQSVEGVVDDAAGSVADLEAIARRVQRVVDELTRARAALADLAAGAAGVSRGPNAK
jgi:ABC-type transporter Mla subunit MlaD